MTVNFVLDHATLLAEGVPLSSADIEYGYSRGWIRPGTVVDLALDAVSDGSDDPVLQRIALLLPDEYGQLDEILSQLTQPPTIHDPRLSARKWLYLQLKAAYMNRSQLADALGVVEQIYADFDYPSSMVRFVRYMPLSGADRPGDHELIKRWEAFLVAELELLRVDRS